MARSFLYLFPVVVLAAWPGCGSTPEEPALARAGTWAIQLQGLERDGAVERLERWPARLVVIEATRTVRGHEAFPTAAVVARLHRAGKLCLAYVNVGQAEDYRTYWPAHWVVPGPERPGRPGFLLGVDPEGWAGNYPVAFWDIRWQAVLWGSTRALVDQALADGFDGAYLDWVSGFDDPIVVAAARRDGVDPARAMTGLIANLRRYARRRDPRFLVVAQNAAGLAERVPELFEVVDGFGQESVLYRGDAGVGWDDPRAGDIAIPATGDWSTETLLRRLDACRARGKPVFLLEYARDRGHIARTHALAAAHGFRPFVSLTPLDRLPPWSGRDGEGGEQPVEGSGERSAGPAR